jgi:hypothetical protein
MGKKGEQKNIYIKANKQQQCKVEKKKCHEA